MLHGQQNSLTGFDQYNSWDGKTCRPKHQSVSLSLRYMPRAYSAFCSVMDAKHLVKGPKSRCLEKILKQLSVDRPIFSTETLTQALSRAVSKLLKSRYKRVANSGTHRLSTTSTTKDRR